MELFNEYILGGWIPMWVIYVLKGVLVFAVVRLLIRFNWGEVKGLPDYNRAIPAVMARVMAYGDACMAGKRGFSRRYPRGRKKSDAPGLPMKEIPARGIGSELPSWMVPDFEKMSEVEQYLELRRRMLEDVEWEMRTQHGGLRWEYQEWLRKKGGIPAPVIGWVAAAFLFVAY